MSLLQDNDNISNVELDVLVGRKLLDLGFDYNYNIGGLTNRLIIRNKYKRKIIYFSALVAYKNHMIALYHPVGEIEIIEITDITDLDLAICWVLDKMNEFKVSLYRDDECELIWENRIL